MNGGEESILEVPRREMIGASVKAARGDVEGEAEVPRISLKLGVLPV